MSAKRGLGRGLTALLGDPPPNGTRGRTSIVERGSEPQPAPETPDDRRGVLREIPTEAIRPNPHQPRRTFDAQAMAELEHSVRELGVLVPLTVRPAQTRGDGEAYEVIAGERRWRAACSAGLRTVPAVVRRADDPESLEIAIVENLQRENLGPLEEAMGFSHLMEERQYTQEALAERLGKSRPAIANALRLLHLPETIKAYVRDGRLSAGQARAILAFPADRRSEIAERAVREELTVRALERLAAAAPAPARRTRALSPDLERVVAALRYRLGTNVAIRAGRRGGRIEIRYATASELTRLIDVLAPGDE